MDFVGLLIFVGGASYKNCFTIGSASYIYLNYNDKLCSSLYTTWLDQFCECMRQQLETRRRFVIEAAMQNLFVFYSKVKGQKS